MIHAVFERFVREGNDVYTTVDLTFTQAALGATVVGLFIGLRFVVAFSGGILMAFGARLAGGCTSGHGVCGIARFSVRSMIATVVFMAAGILTVFVIRHVL